MGNNMGERLAKHFEVDSNNEGGSHLFILSISIVPLFLKETALNFFLIGALAHHVAFL
jgi:beta-glucosidase-like glycosyl hydrolase